MFWVTCTGRHVLLAALISVTWPLAIHGDEPPGLHRQIDQLLASPETESVAAQADDAEFLRRLMLDFSGRIPTGVEVREFVASNAPDKRRQLLDELLSRPGYARRMRDQMHIMLMERLGDDSAWLDWLEQSFRENKPWDQLVRELLDPDAEHEINRGAAFFWTERLKNYGQNPVDYPALTRDVGRLFLGVDLQCAQCHDHLYVDEYKQADYHGLSAFVSQTFIRKDVSYPAVGEKVLAAPLEFVSVFTQEAGTTGPRLPNGEELAIPMFPKGEEFEIPPDKKTKFSGRPRFRPLSALAEQVTRDDNMAFARNSVNRFWFLMFGRGQVQPLDLHHADNPATHPEVLDLLTREFVAHKFDVKWLLRELALTEAYQRSSRRPEGIDSLPANSYAVAWERPLSAEQLLASTVIALGQPDLSPVVLSEDADAPANKTHEQALKKFRDAFANVPRDPEGDFRPSVKAALFLMNDAGIQDWFQSTEPGTTLSRLAALDDAQLAEELYLATLSRFPADHEAAFIQKLLETPDANRPRLIGHLLWGLVSSAEFALNH